MPRTGSEGGSAPPGPSATGGVSPRSFLASHDGSRSPWSRTVCSAATSPGGSPQRPGKAAASGDDEVIEV